MLLVNRHRLILGVVLWAFFLLGAVQVRITDDASSGMLSTNVLKASQYRDFLSRFQSDQSVVIVAENLICSEDGWNLFTQLVDEFRQSESVEKVTSIASNASKYIVAKRDNIDLSAFREVEFSSAMERCKAAYSYKPFQDLLVTSGGETTAIFLLSSLEFNAVNLDAEYRKIVEQYVPQAQSLGGNIILTGEPIMSAEVSRVIASDSAYILLNIGIMLGLLYCLTRSLYTLVAALGLIVFVLTVAYGAMGWLGVTLTPATSLVVFLLVPLSSAFVVHACGYSTDSRVITKPQVQGRSVFLWAGLTTAIGFMSTGFTPAADIQNMAVMGVVGVTAATLGVYLIVFPILERRLDLAFFLQIKPPIRVLANPAYGYIFLIFLGALTLHGLMKVSVNYRPTNYLQSSNPHRVEFDMAGNYFGRMNLPFVVNVEDVEEPQTWVKLEPLVEELKGIYEDELQISWFRGQMAELTKAFTLNDSGEYIDFPTDKSMFSQLLLLFDPDDLELFMDHKKEQILITFHIPFEGSRDYLELKERVEFYMSEQGMNGYFVGRVSSFFETGHRMGTDTLRGLLVSGVIVFFLLWTLFKSVGLALAGILVNALPVFSGLSALGFFNIDIDMGSSIVAAVAFGIVLDDSTHLLFRVRKHVISGYDPSTAVTKALDDLIVPIVTTTLIISVGFAVLLFAELRPFNDFAVVILVTLGAALLTDLLVLPLLVKKFFIDPIR